MKIETLCMIGMHQNVFIRHIFTPYLYAIFQRYLEKNVNNFPPNAMRQLFTSDEDRMPTGNSV